VKCPCPCCGYLVFETLGSDEFCPICGWQDDISQLRFPEEGGGENSVSLIEAQRNFATSGSSDPRLAAFARPPTPQDSRDPDWRPLDPRQDDIERPVRGVDYGTTYPADRTALYYWRRRSRDIP
jgi:hypothetical protein